MSGSQNVRSLRLTAADRNREFETMFRADYAAVVAVALSLTGRLEVAEEVTQDAFLRAHERWERVGSLDIPGAWVRRVAINLALSDRRRRAAEVRAVSRFARYSQSEVPHEGAGGVEAEQFWSLVRSLPRKQAAIVVLYYLEDRSVADIADVLGLAVGTVKAHLHKARRSLAETLAIDEGEVE